MLPVVRSYTQAKGSPLCRKRRKVHVRHQERRHCATTGTPLLKWLLGRPCFCIRALLTDFLWGSASPVSFFLLFLRVQGHCFMYEVRIFLHTTRMMYMFLSEIPIFEVPQHFDLIVHVYSAPASSESHASTAPSQAPEFRVHRSGPPSTLGSMYRKSTCTAIYDKGANYPDFLVTFILFRHRPTSTGVDELQTQAGPLIVTRTAASLSRCAPH